MEFLAVVAVITVLMFLIASIAALIERLPPFPPMYEDEDVLPPPNVRSQRSGREGH